MITSVTIVQYHESAEVLDILATQSQQSDINRCLRIISLQCEQDMRLASLQVMYETSNDVTSDLPVRALI